MDWVCVSEQLPETSDDVLAYSPDDGCFRAWCDNGTWLTHENIHNPPTHWMMLPEPPRRAIGNPSGSYGMTDHLISSDNRPYSVWSDNIETAKDICKVWESRFGGPYKVSKAQGGYVVKYMGKWDVDMSQLA